MWYHTKFLTYIEAAKKTLPRIDKNDVKRGQYIYTRQVLYLKHRKKYTENDGRDALVMVTHPAHVQILSIQ